MPKFRKMTRTTAARVLHRMAEMCENEDVGDRPGQVRPEDSYAQWFAELIDPALSQMECEDAFGTEGQLDPRGDHRD
jgi:hypothetical protein